MNDYFEVSHAIEQRLRDEMPEVDKVCSFFTENNATELAKCDVSAHINMIASQFDNHTGHGQMQTEYQRWQVSLCFKSPKNAVEEAALREKAGVLLLKLRRVLQGFQATPTAKAMSVTANHSYLTADCRFRVFGFTFQTSIVI